MAKNNNLLLFGAVGLLALAFVMSQPQGTTTTIPQPGVVINQPGVGYATTLRASGFDPLGAAATNVNVYVRNTDDSARVDETQANAALTSISTSMPNSFSGSIYIGNDATAATGGVGAGGVGTDRGTEYYFVKQPIEYTNTGEVVVGDIKTYQEGTVTVSAYDDGTVEASPNITVGSGATVDTSEFRISVSADSAFGNPQLENPIAFCANATVPANWDTIRPLNYVSTIPVPGMFSGRNFIGGSCYVLPTAAIMDAPNQKNDYRGFFRLQATTSVNPGTEQVRIGFIDKTYYLDDARMFRVGWEDASDNAADADIGAIYQSLDLQIF